MWVLLLVLVAIFIFFKVRIHRECYTNYLQDLLKKENRMHPFRYFTDSEGTVLPIVAVTGFFRGDDAREKYQEYLDKKFNVFGITAYKSFPNKKLLGKEEGQYEKDDTFDYTREIRSWMCCFRQKESYGFTPDNNVVDMSESDFYTVETSEQKRPKKYDFIYICSKDDDTCPLDGWNAVNRNFVLAKKCFPIMCKEFKLKGLVVGRTNCGLEAEYGDRIEVTEWMEWDKLQDKMRESRFLFLPNIQDASPRVIAECLIKDVPVLMNHNIMCGFKYVHPETGEFFHDERDFKQALTRLMDRIDTISPAQWWETNYSHEQSQKNLRDFLAEAFPQEPCLKNIDRVKFIL